MAEMIVVGIAGEIGSGKDTVAECLVNQFGFTHISLSNVVARGRRRRGLPETRNSQLDYANGERDSVGGDVFVKLALGEASENGATRVVLSGIYCLEEAGSLIDHFGGILLGVIGPSADERYERVISRMANRTDVMTRTQFDEMARNENAGSGGRRPNVTKVLERANALIENQSHKDDLCIRVDEAMTELLPRVEKTTGLVNSLSGPNNALHAERMRLYYLQYRHVAGEFVSRVFKRTDLENESERSLAQFQNGLHPVHQITNDFMDRLLQVFLIPDLSDSLNSFRSLDVRTVDEEMVSLINDGQFRDFHRNLHAHLQTNEEGIQETVTELMDVHRSCDEIQFANNKKRNLWTMREDGINMTVDSSGVDVLLRAQGEAGRGVVPVTELVKTARILHVSDFSESKVSLTIHDFIDHLWLYDLLDRKGILKKHFPLLQSIGNPAATDIYRREGEIIASIGFGVRLWASQHVGFVPQRGIGDIAAEMYRHFESCSELTPEIMDIHKYVRSLDRNPTSRRAQSLGFTFNNYLIELDEQRRKHGEIRRRDVETEIVIGYLDPWSHDFMCLFIDVHRELMDSRNKHRDNLLRTHIMVEEFLMSEEALDQTPMNLSLSDLGKTLETTSIPYGRVDWMSRHHGFSAVRESFV